MSIKCSLCSMSLSTYVDFARHLKLRHARDSKCFNEQLITNAAVEPNTSNESKKSDPVKSSGKKITEMVLKTHFDELKHQFHKNYKQKINLQNQVRFLEQENGELKEEIKNMSKEMALLRGTHNDKGKATALSNSKESVVPKTEFDGLKLQFHNIYKQKITLQATLNELQSAQVFMATEIKQLCEHIQNLNFGELTCLARAEDKQRAPDLRMGMELDLLKSVVNRMVISNPDIHIKQNQTDSERQENSDRNDPIITDKDYHLDESNLVKHFPKAVNKSAGTSIETLTCD